MGPKVGWGRASRNHQGGANRMSQVDGISEMVPACSVVLLGEGSEKGQWPLTAFLLESCPQGFTLMLNNSVPPHGPLVPFNLLLPCWSAEGASPSKSVHGPLRETARDSRKVFVFDSLNPSGS